MVGAVGIAHGAPLRHIVQDSDSAESMQLGRVCYGLLATKERLHCLPRSYLEDEGGRLSIDFLVKANDKAFTAAKRILDQDVDREFVDDLFKEQSFQSVAGVAVIEARFRGTSLTYAPVHAVGAFTIDNPSLPELHVAGASQSVLRLTQNILLEEALPHGDLLLSPSLYYYDRTTAFLDTDVLTAAGENLETLLERQETRKGDGDLAVAYMPTVPYVPAVTLRVDHIGAKDPCDDCRERPIVVEPLFGRQSSVAIASDIPHPIGKSLFGLRLPFNGAYRTFQPLDTTFAYTYKLSSLGSYLSYSARIATFGFVFDADFYRLGIMYSDEKQDSSLRIKRQKQVYAFVGFQL